MSGHDLSSGASGGCLHGGASFEVEKAHFAVRETKGPENRKNEAKLRPPLCRPLKHSMMSGPKGPKIEKIQPGLKFSIEIDNFISGPQNCGQTLFYGHGDFSI